MSKPSSDSAGIRQTIRALRAGGYKLDYVYDGGDDVPVSNEDEAIDAILAVDDAFLHVTIANPSSHTTTGIITTTGWVRFVMGNEPEEVVCDHTVNLSDVLDPLMDSWDED